jgi:hypothetical protein
MGVWRMAIALLCRRGEMSNKMGAATEKSPFWCNCSVAGAQGAGRDCIISALS